MSDLSPGARSLLEKWKQDFLMDSDLSPVDRANMAELVLRGMVENRPMGSISRYYLTEAGRGEQMRAHFGKWDRRISRVRKNQQNRRPPPVIARAPVSAVSSALGMKSVEVKFRASPGKVPKRRFGPGQYVRLEGDLFEVIFCYRVSSTHDWQFCLEERASVTSSGDGNALCTALADAGAGEDTNRVEDRLFNSMGDVHTWFADIPAMSGYRRHVTNQTMMGAEVVSSGRVIDDR